MYAKGFSRNLGERCCLTKRAERTYKGYWVVKQKTAKARFSRALKAIYQWCKDHRHAPVQWQHRQLCRKLLGHYNYYGITGNHDALERFHRRVEEAWYKWLARRSQSHSQARLTFLDS